MKVWGEFEAKNILLSTFLVKKVFTMNFFSKEFSEILRTAKPSDSCYLCLGIFISKTKHGSIYQRCFKKNVFLKF